MISEYLSNTNPLLFFKILQISSHSRNQPDENMENEALKKCPFCAETINKDARKCKHCGEILDPELRSYRAEQSQQTVRKERKWSPGVAELP